MIALGIETSCDETSVALVNSNREILSHLILSQHDYHADYQGVVPEIAARAHLEHLPRLIQSALAKANLTFDDVSLIAATTGPGLIGGVIVGAMLGKGLAHSLNIPFIAVNHLEGHVLSSRLSHPELNFPYLSLLMSGGHTQIIHVKNVGSYEIWGNAIDDAVGECFDKVAKMMKLPYPGGPEIEKLAKLGDPKAFTFPRPLRHEQNCNFSFSGLKTAVKYTIDKLPLMTDQIKADVAASFQEAVADVLTSRLHQACRLIGDKDLNITYLTSGGGVAANRYLKEKMLQLLLKEGISFYAPPQELCTDNGAMIAWAGLEHYKLGNNKGGLTTKPRPRWPLDEVQR